VAVALASVATAAAARSPAVVLDYDGGPLLLAADADRPWYPASLTKLMTVYLAFEALESNELEPGETLTASEYAASQTGTRLGLAKGTTLTVMEAIQATVLRSANDAAVVLAERMGGSEPAFAEQMTERARTLGMTATVFRNATGLPDPHQFTTAADMALLARTLIHDFPERYALFGTRTMAWHGHQLSNINGLLASFAGADGLKTGFTCGSGYNIVASAAHDGRRLIAVLLGATSLDARHAEITRLLDAAFAGTVPKEYATPAKADGAVKLAAAIKPVLPAGCDPASATTAALAAPALQGWALTVGNAHQERDAKAMLDTARTALGGDLRGGRPLIVQRYVGALPPYRALVVGYPNEDKAIATCMKLRRADVHCIVISPEQLAARHAIWN
jgi:D-alanyl-D-alanine carboxypeptidase